MIIDHRTYELQLGAGARHPRPPRERRGFRCSWSLSAISSVTSPVTWTKSYTDGRAKTSPTTPRAMAADAAWQFYLQNSREFLKTMNNKILVPTSFSPTK